MPRTVVRNPEHTRLRSLGGIGVAWIEYFVRHGPGAVQGMPITLGSEYAGFVMDFYALLPDGKRCYDHCFLSRPKGTNKSGVASYLALFEGLGPCRFAGFAKGGEVYRDPWGLGFEYVYEAGEPMGKPVHVPMIRIMATEETQTSNCFDTIYYNLTDEDCPLSKVPGVDAGRTRILLPRNGSITPSTASSASKDGGKETFVVFDETHLYNTPELKRMYKTVTRNTVKLRGTAAEPWYIETTTMFGPGEESVAELTFREAEAILTGKKKRGRVRLFYDHRWGDVEDVTDEMSLIAGIKEAFGEAIGWNDIQAILDEFYSMHADEADSRRYFLNAETSSTDMWLDINELNACKAPEKRLQPGDVVALGFDGSINDDSSALVACRVSDGHLQLLGLWEKPENVQANRRRKPKAKVIGADFNPETDEDDETEWIGEWRVDEEAVDAAVADAFKTYTVVAFFADPPHWQSHINKWQADYGRNRAIKGKSTASRPFEWWTNRPTQMVMALHEFEIAVKGKGISYTPAEDLMDDEKSLAISLKRAFLNCFRKPTRAGLQIRKEFPKSPRKIDPAMAAVLAYTARGAAIAAGVRTGPAKKRVARRVR